MRDVHQSGASSKRDRAASEAARLALAKRAADAERDYYTANERSLTRKAQANAMYRTMRDSADAVQEHREAFDAAAAKRDDCDLESRKAALREATAREHKKTFELNTSDVVKLPILESQVQSAPFFAITPWLVIVVYVYLRLYLSQLQERLFDFDSWATARHWTLSRRQRAVHPWVGSFAFYGNPIACVAMLVAATWGTPCALALMYEWQPNKITQLALVVSVCLTLTACIEARNPSGMRVARDSLSESADWGIRSIAMWNIWALGPLAAAAFVCAHAAPPVWKGVMAFLLRARA